MLIKKKILNDLILSPPIQLKINGHAGLLLFLFPSVSPLLSLFVNLLQIDFVIRLIPYRRCVWSMCWRGCDENEMHGYENKEMARFTDTEP